MTGVFFTINKKKEMQVVGTPSRVKAVVPFNLEIKIPLKRNCLWTSVFVWFYPV